jgi:tyrosine-protein phosphatase SIW14
MRLSSLLLAVFLWTASFAAHAQSPASAAPSSVPIGEKISLPGIHNAGKVSDQLYRGAQPSLSSLAELKKLGITTIVDLRAEFQNTSKQERQQTESLGLHFVRIPVGGFSNPSSAQLAEFFSLIRATPAQKIFVHCAFGDDRTGVFIASYRIAFQHWSADQALSEMMAFGYNRFWHPSMTTFVRQLPDRLHSDPVLRKSLDSP